MRGGTAVTEPRVTSFQRRVYDACRRIPAGRVASYGDLGHAIGCGSAQAVGQALRRNPFAPEVPCHRVVRGNGALCGFSGHREGPELERKRRMLMEEGVPFGPDGRVAAEGFWYFGRSERQETEFSLAKAGETAKETAAGD